MPHKPTNRRTFLRRSVSAAAGLGLTSGVLAPQRASAAEQSSRSPGKTTKIVLMGHKPDHPPGTHLYMHESGLLAKCLGQTPGVEAIVSDGWPADPNVITDAAAIVLYSSPGAEILLAGPHAKQVDQILKSGVGLTAIHWATGIRDKDNLALADRYLGQLGGLFSFAFCGLAFDNTQVRHVAPNHEVSRGCTDYPTHDEFYLDLKFLPTAVPVTRVRVKEKDQTVGWVYERPESNGGRSFGNTLGHFHKNFCSPGFRQDLINGILWTAHCDIPSDGAPCKLTEKELELPQT
jgi:type 1 glutamine amidotransferase